MVTADAVHKSRFCTRLDANARAKQPRMLTATCGHDGHYYYNDSHDHDDDNDHDYDYERYH